MAFFNTQHPIHVNGNLLQNGSIENTLNGIETAELEETTVTEKVDELLNLNRIANSISYQPVLPNSVTKSYLEKVFYVYCICMYIRSCHEITLSPN